MKDDQYYRNGVVMGKTTKHVAFMGMAAALVFISGYVIKIPVMNGYYNLEDTK